VLAVGTLVRMGVYASGHCVQSTIQCTEMAERDAPRDYSQIIGKEDRTVW